MSVIIPSDVPIPSPPPVTVFLNRTSGGIRLEKYQGDVLLATDSFNPGQWGYGQSSGIYKYDKLVLINWYGADKYVRITTVNDETHANDNYATISTVSGYELPFDAFKNQLFTIEDASPI